MKGCMTVRRLVTALKKMPQDALVVFHDHDQNADEFNSYVGSVHESEPELIAELEKRHGRKIKCVTLGW
jgi:hypothetical protein